MNDADVLRKLEALREEANRIIKLFENGRVPEVQRRHAQELFRDLKEKLQADYKRMSTARGEAALSEVEAHFYQPAIQDAWANTVISSIHWNSRPSAEWREALWNVSDYMEHWIAGLKRAGESD